MELLPVISGKRLTLDHFPDPLCAFVYRNWGIVGTDVMAAVIGATEEKVAQLGLEMGLRSCRADERWLKYGYLTVIRSNWHLIDYSQLCMLLNWDDEKLAFVIKEEDFFGEKLGGFKPDTGKLEWHAFDRSSLPEIKRITEAFYGKLPPETAAPFDFAPVFEKAAADRRSGAGRYSSARSAPGEGISSSAGSAARERSSSSAGKNLIERIVYPYCALYGDTFMEDLGFSFPDCLLEAYRSAGITGIWCQAVLYKLAPFPFEPSLSEGWEERLANMRALTERLARYGLKLWLYLNEPRSMPKSFFEKNPDLKGEEGADDACLCTSVPAVRKYLYDAAATVAEAVPLLGGFFTIVASENRTNCFSKSIGGVTSCPRCRMRSRSAVMAEVNEALYEGAASRNPAIRLIAWDWGMDLETALEFTEKLPRSVAVMGVSEQDMRKNIAGIETRVIDYSISVVGPGDFAKKVWARAKQTGHQAFAKLQLNNSWECSFVPFLPAFRQIYTHIKRLGELEIDGMFLSWTLGGFPSLSMKLIAPMFQEEITPPLRSLYARIFPEESLDTVEKACGLFSDAFDSFPFDLEVLYKGPQNFGPSCLLFSKPSGFDATMVGYPYDDLAHWRGRFPADVFEDQFRKLSEIWELGLKALEALPAKLLAENAALRELYDSAEAAFCHFRSSYLQIRFIGLRDGLEKGQGDKAETAEIAEFAENAENTEIAEMAEIAEEEASLALRLASVQRRNPCIGYESSNHYFYHTGMLAEKYLNAKIMKDLTSGNA
ncbi:MAG: hypothetical protein ILO53_07295 [Clostridia bacterium]|nr:hypothetical protein [Clostridia bacterium]